MAVNNVGCVLNERLPDLSELFRAISLVLLLLVAAASGISAEQAKSWRFTFITPLRGGIPESYWVTVGTGIQTASRDFKVDTIETGPMYGFDEAQMIQAIDSAIAAKVDGIITMAKNPREFTVLINKATAAGIPVVLVDSDAPESNRIAYVGTDNYAAGLQAAKIMVQIMKGQGRVGIISSSSETQNLQLRIKGFVAGIVNSPGLQIVDQRIGKTDILTQCSLAQSMLDEHPDISGIFGVDGSASAASALVIKQNNFRDKISVVGFDYEQHIAQSVGADLVKASIIQNGYQIGYEAVRILVAFKNGVSPTQPVFYTGTTVVFPAKSGNEK